MARESDFTPLFRLPRWSFGLRQLFFWTAAIALGLVALRSASPTWVSAMLGLALAVLSVSILFIIFRRGPQRAFWIGFTTLGWLYILLLFSSWTLGRTATNDSPLRARNLITQKLSTVSYHWLHDKAFEDYNASMSNTNAGVMGGGQVFYFGSGGMGGSGEAGYDAAAVAPPGSSSTGEMNPRASGAFMFGSAPMAVSFATPAGQPPGPNETDFVNVAHALWTLLFAALGGCVAYWLYSTGPARTERQATASS